MEAVLGDTCMQVLAGSRKKDALFWQKASFSMEINSYKPLALFCIIIFYQIFKEMIWTICPDSLSRHLHKAIGEINHVFGIGKNDIETATFAQFRNIV